MPVNTRADGLAEIAGQAVQRILHLRDLVDRLEDAPREAARLDTDLVALQAVLESIDPLARAVEPALERAVQRCDAEVRTIQALVQGMIGQECQKGRGIAEWLKRLLRHRRMVLPKLKLQRRIRALERRQEAVRLAAAVRQAPAVRGPGLASRQSPAQTRTQTAVRPSEAPVRHISTHATFSQSYIYTYKYEEALAMEPLETSEYGAHSGLGHGTAPPNTFRPTSSFPPERGSGARPRIPSRPSTPSSVPSLTRPTMHEHRTDVVSDDSHHDDSDSCDSFATAQLVDIGACGSDSSHRSQSSGSQSSGVSGRWSPSEPATPRCPPHHTEPKGGPFAERHRDSAASSLTSFSETELLPNPEPYQGRDSDDEGADMGPPLPPLGRHVITRYVPHF